MTVLVLTPKQRLSPDCEDQIRVIIEESALDYRLDPQLQMHCSEEVGAFKFNPPSHYICWQVLMSSW